MISGRGEKDKYTRPVIINVFTVQKFKSDSHFSLENRRVKYITVCPDMQI